MWIRNYLQKRQRVRELERIASRVREGCTYEEFAQCACPWCSNPVTIVFHPRGTSFRIECDSRNLWHFSKQYKIDKPPDWWKDHIATFVLD